jgi:hypothetical protein
MAKPTALVPVVVTASVLEAAALPVNPLVAQRLKVYALLNRAAERL